MEENRQLITYDENWRSVAGQETPVVRDSSNESEEAVRAPRPFTPPRHLLLSLQLAACLLLAAAALALKAIGGEVYETAREYYKTQINAVALFDGENGAELFFGATADEA